MDDLKAKVEAWKAGTASRDEVEAAARNVVATVSSQASAAGGALKSALTAVGRALGTLVETITKPGVTDSEIQAAADGVTAAASALAVSCPS